MTSGSIEMTNFFKVSYGTKLCFIFAHNSGIMAEDLQIARGTKEEQYEALLRR